MKGERQRPQPELVKFSPERKRARVRDVGALFGETPEFARDPRVGPATPGDKVRC